MGRMSIRIAPLSDILGSEITGLDLSRPVDDATFAKVEAALNATHLLVFRDQAKLTPEAHIAFSRRWSTRIHGSCH